MGWELEILCGNGVGMKLWGWGKSREQGGDRKKFMTMEW